LSGVSGICQASLTIGGLLGGCTLAYLWVSKSVFSVLSPFQKSSYENSWNFFQKIQHLSLFVCFGLCTRSDGSILSFFFFDLTSWSNHPPPHRSDGTSKTEIERGFQKSWSHPR
jgi:hypothetical protein